MREKRHKEGNIEKKEFMLWLCSLPGIGNVRGGRLLKLCEGSAERLYHAPKALWREVVSESLYENVRRFTDRWRLWEEYVRLEEKGIGFIHIFEETYPDKLREIPDAPLGLFYRGRLPEKKEASVAVVGARDCSEYGRYVARELGEFLGRRGIGVVSGMARGIDGISQQAALDSGGRSYGVLGCGVDICYPAANRGLYERLLEQGGILSAYPPGTEPKPGNFPPRNRIVSGMADALVVIEARERSGTLITVDMALEQGREVFVVPGRITDKLSDGCNGLLRQGARIFLSPGDFLEEMFLGAHTEPFTYQETTRGEVGSGNLRTDITIPDSREREALEPQLRQVYEALDFTPRTLEQIRDRLSFSCSVGSLGAMLITLCVKRLALQVSPGCFCVSGKY